MNEIIVPMNVKRCAHCGGAASIELVSSLYRFKCNQCEASTQLCRTPDEALCRWNRRYESIVHCDDCKHYNLGFCRKLIWRNNGFSVSICGDCFCAWGERRE